MKAPFEYDAREALDEAREVFAAHGGDAEALLALRLSPASRRQAGHGAGDRSVALRHRLPGAPRDRPLPDPQPGTVGSSTVHADPASGLPAVAVAVAAVDATGPLDDVHVPPSSLHTLAGHLLRQGLAAALEEALRR